ncbi:nucleotide exchange factor GrpE [Actinacidiphila rubida]|uniref:Uncharacterized protein n=1 Tax=Actinacidiphila rubida TaxID=310780 RepID=A0A1H8TQA6_9ACTN|nr:hypothetical protein [Actinacidiphila rubida]SEO93199.1 hypothetical protein SAMN05216267_10573 [Actinacidiphila rubida]
MSGDSKWMVGFRSHEVGRVVQRFYLVDGSVDIAAAHRSASRMAELELGRHGRPTAPDVTRGVVQRVGPDVLGNICLSAAEPHVTTGREPEPSAEREAR